MRYCFNLYIASRKLCKLLNSGRAETTVAFLTALRTKKGSSPQYKVKLKIRRAVSYSENGHVNRRHSKLTSSSLYQLSKSVTPRAAAALPPELYWDDSSEQQWSAMAKSAYIVHHGPSLSRMQALSSLQSEEGAELPHQGAARRGSLLSTILSQNIL